MLLAPVVQARSQDQACAVEAMMDAIDESMGEQQVACEICLKQIPLSEAKSDEASDYVRYFCGLECYARWRAQEKQQDPGA